MVASLKLKTGRNCVVIGSTALKLYTQRQVKARLTEEEEGSEEEGGREEAHNLRLFDHIFRLHSNFILPVLLILL